MGSKAKRRTTASPTTVYRSAVGLAPTAAEIRRSLLSALPDTHRGLAEQCSMCAEALDVFVHRVTTHAPDAPRITSISVKPGSLLSAARELVDAE